MRRLKVSIDNLLIRSMGQGVVEHMLYQKWVLISRSAELNEIAWHASPHPKKTLEHTICLSKRVDADQRCLASDLHLELKFAGVMTWSSGADLEATKCGSHKLRRAGANCDAYAALSALFGRNPSIKLRLGREQRHSESSATRASRRLSKGRWSRARPAQKGRAHGRSGLVRHVAGSLLSALPPRRYKPSNKMI